MFGIFLFWLEYIIAGIVLYTILRGTYKVKKVNKIDHEYEKTNERYKRPLWQILLFIVLFFIPVINLSLIAYMVASSYEEDSKLYYKSFITKKY